MSEIGDYDLASARQEAQRSTLLEGMRRCCLVVGLFLSVLCATWTDFRPYLAISEPSEREFASIVRQYEKVTEVASPTGKSTESEDKREDARSDDAPALIIVNSSQWVEWFLKVTKGIHLGQMPPEWMHRLTNDDIKSSKRFQAGKTSFKPTVWRLIFDVKEPPLEELFSTKKPGTSYVLCLEQAGEAQFLEVYYAQAPELHGLGTSVYGMPDAFSYPLRKYWFIPLLFSLAGYILVPWQRRKGNVCAFPRWQIVLGDIAGIMLYGVFMALPFFIVGGFVEALTTWILFSAFFLGMAAFGLSCLWWSDFFAIYQIHILQDSILFVSPKGVEQLRYTDMQLIEPVMLVPPKWLIVLTAISALCARGSAAIGASGRAAILASSSMSGLCIATRQDKAFYIWSTNSMGEVSLSNWDILCRSLKQSGIQQVQDIREIACIFPPIVETYSKRKQSRILKADDYQDSHHDDTKLTKNSSSPSQRRKQSQIQKDDDYEASNRNDTKLTKQENSNTSPQKLMLSKVQMEALAEKFRQVRTKKLLPESQFKTLHAAFKGQDSQGRTWTVALKNLDWHVKKNGKWLLETNVPQELEVESNLVHQLDKLLEII